MYTWGATAVPEEGDFIVVPPGQVLLVDVNTPILKMILIQGKAGRKFCQAPANVH